MNQMATYVVIMTGLMVLFYIFGIGTAPLLDLLQHPESMSVTSFFANITVGLLTSAGLVLGLVYRNAELAAMSAVLPVVINVLWFFTNVVYVIMSINAVLGMIVFTPLMFLFMMTVVEYWRGRD